MPDKKKVAVHSIVAAILVALIGVFSMDLYADYLMWLIFALLVIALVSVPAGLILTAIEALEKSEARFLPAIPRLLLGTTSLVLTPLLLLPLFDLITGDDSPLHLFLGLLLCGGLLLVIGVGWIRKAVLRMTGKPGVDSASASQSDP